MLKMMTTIWRVRLMMRKAEYSCAEKNFCDYVRFYEQKDMECDGQNLPLTEPCLEDYFGFLELILQWGCKFFL